jgi:cell division septal protein FtsQ
MTWLKRRSRNRLHRHDLKGLDAKMRSKLRAQRQTILLGLCSVAVLVVGLISWGAWLGFKKGMREMFSENVNYRITNISVDSTGETLKPERVLAYLRIQRGQNLMAVDIQEIRRQLESLPMVEKAEVARELPSRLVIRITERVPIANISAASRDIRYQIDSHGVIMDLMPYQKNPDFRQRLEALPDIIGANVGDIKIGSATPSPEVLLAIKFLQKLQQSDSGLDIDTESIDVSRRGFITIATADHIFVKLSDDDLERQLRRLAVVMEDARQRSARIATIDLTVGGKDVPTTFASIHLNQ